MKLSLFDSPDNVIKMIFTNYLHIDCMKLFKHTRSMLILDEEEEINKINYSSLSCVDSLANYGNNTMKKNIVCNICARYGALRSMRWARDYGCPWNEYTCSNAARNGYLEILKYAHENGCPWDKDTCSNAAYGGHLEILKYAHDNGCPWDKDECLGCAKSTEIVNWIKSSVN